MIIAFPWESLTYLHSYSEDGNIKINQTVLWRRKLIIPLHLLGDKISNIDDSEIYPTVWPDGQTFAYTFPRIQHGIVTGFECRESHDCEDAKRVVDLQLEIAGIRIINDSLKVMM